eukprot:scaffold67453_cov27-Phaeocystis_antarctica.AAC.1
MTPSSPARSPSLGIPWAKSRQRHQAGPPDTGRRSRSPGRTGTIPGASDIYESQTARSCSSL